MADTILDFVIAQLGSAATEKLKEEVVLVKSCESEVEKLKRNLKDIKALLEDVEKKQLSINNTVELWLQNLKDVSLEMEEVLDEWNSAVVKFNIQNDDAAEHHHPKTKNKVYFSIRSLFSCCGTKVNRLALRHSVGNKIKDLNQRLDEIASEKQQYTIDTTVTEKAIERPMTTSFIDKTEVKGRDEENEILVSKLLGESNTQNDKTLQVIPIVGVEGAGKTTLAKIAYNDDKVVAHFELRIWVCVSDHFDEIKVAKAIIEAVEGSSPNISALESLMQHVVKCIDKKRFLLVLDDVWTKKSEKWEHLRLPLKIGGGEGSRVVVTTPLEEVAIMMDATDHMITLEKL